MMSLLFQVLFIDAQMLTQCAADQDDILNGYSWSTGDCFREWLSESARAHSRGEVVNKRAQSGTTSGVVIFLLAFTCTDFLARSPIGTVLEHVTNERIEIEQNNTVKLA